jgi:hypothetical protein
VAECSESVGSAASASTARVSASIASNTSAGRFAAKLFRDAILVLDADRYPGFFSLLHDFVQVRRFTSFFL